MRLPSVAVLPFRNLSVDAELDYVALGFSQELSDALTSYEDIRVIGMASREAYDGSMLSNPDESGGQKIEYLIDGDLRSRGQEVRVGIRLLEAKDGRQVWSTHSRLNLEHDDLFEVQEQVARKVASHVGGEYGQINKTRLDAIRSSRPRSLAEQDVLLKHYSLNITPNEGLEAEFNKTVREALAAEPESALLNALVAGNYGGLWQMAVPGAQDALEKVEFHAEKAYVINPAHQIVQSTLGYKCFLFDERQRFFELFEQIEDVLPSSPLRLGGWAWLISSFGEWERGKALLDKVLEQNVHVPGWLYGVECLYYYRLHDYEAALAAANRYHIQGLFWGPVCRVVTLGQLGRQAEADAEIQTLLTWRPDFKENARTLFDRMFKEDSLIEHLFEGLDKAGLQVD